MTTPQDKTTPADVLRKALELLGPNGKHWFGGGIEPDAVRCRCAGIAITDLHEPIHVQRLALAALAKVIGRDAWLLSIGVWNDSPSRTFPEVRAAFERAIEMAEKGEAS